MMINYVVRSDEREDSEKHQLIVSLSFLPTPPTTQCDIHFDIFGPFGLWNRWYWRL